jgi:vacuolar-type H+-ATPase subunit C/Vma6
VRDEDIRGIAAGADISQVVRRIYPQVTDVDALLQETPTGLPKLELQLRRLVVDQCHTAFVGSPFHIGIPLAFLFLADFEIQDLVVLIEAKSNHVTVEEYRQHLLMGAPEKA